MERRERADGTSANGGTHAKLKGATDEISAAVAEDLAAFDIEAAEAESETALARGTDLPSTGLLSFYDTLRVKIIKAVEKHTGKLPGDVLRMLLLVPDVFILLVRLTLDKSVPGPTRTLIGGALAYFILPFDLLPEAILGPVGYLDDLVLAAAVLSQAFGGELEPYARKHWSGDEDLRVVLRDITLTAHKLLGHNLYERLKKLLGRRGIEIQE